MADLQKARAAKSRLRTQLSGEHGIRGVGLTPVDGGYRLQVNVDRPADRKAVPSHVDGVGVDVRVVGPIAANS